jgi:imidazole glycerol-phosphate synthase subunit HisH
MIVILNYGIGNILSIKNMLKKIGYDCIIASSGKDVDLATKIILPGVGNFDYGMNMLRKAPFFSVFQDRVKSGTVPVLGICLGAQMLMDSSEEGTESGLGLIRGNCRKFDKSRMSQGLTIPNMGWADVSFIKNTSLNKGITKTPRYYFVHSFHLCCANDEDVLAIAEYGYTFTAAINTGNIYGVQFHPEKSHKFGMQILNNFALL